jgi:carbon monoxide dehydrogenase subunit G
MKIVNRIDVRATPEAVFHWLEDPERAMQWMTSVTRSEIIKETPSRVGTTFREYIEEDGRGTEMHGVVTEFVSNERFAVHLEGDFNSVDVSFSLEEKAGVTQLTQNVQLSFKGMLKVLSAFLRASIKKKIVNQAQKELAKLKELCERES